MLTSELIHHLVEAMAREDDQEVFISHEAGQSGEVVDVHSSGSLLFLRDWRESPTFDPPWDPPSKGTHESDLTPNSMAGYIYPDEPGSPEPLINNYGSWAGGVIEHHNARDWSRS